MDQNASADIDDFVVIARVGVTNIPGLLLSGDLGADNIIV